MDRTVDRMTGLPVARLGALIVGLALLAAGVAFVATLGVLSRIEAERAEGRLALYVSGIEAELGRVTHLPHILAQDPVVRAVAGGAAPGRLNARLADYAPRAEVDAIYLMNRAGLTLAASNAGTDGSFVGQSYAFRPYFTEALAGRTGTFFGVGATTRRPGYFIAEAVRDGTGAVLGVLAIKLDLSRLERDWAGADEAVRVLNGDGVTILTSRDDWRYRSTAPLDGEQIRRMRDSRQFGAEALSPVPLPRDMILRDMDAAPWRVGYAPATGTAALWAFIAAGAVAVSMILASLVWTGRQAVRATGDLRKAAAKEAALRRMNRRLTEEISERQLVETRLREAQAELVRTGRLAVLGRLAASVCHELGQPIAAMRNHLYADTLGPETDSGLAGRIGGLVDRLDGITRQLKFFARSDGPVMASVPLSEVTRYAQEVLADRISGVTLHGPRTDAQVRGDRHRLEQVAVNLLRNAIDAVEGLPEPIVRIEIDQDGDHARLTISDNGPGLSVPLDQAVEPFFTTRASGEGTGLGLAISAEIVHEHGGTLTAGDSDLGGAAFAIRLPLS
ncbi:ATP-binding protein [Jannaschia sp. M317]|uniref:sensor histidine kinase n=1 Tax=Jannaschia sp. M317 TaxID=2867011 RepID=UPI0021A6EF29|nr:ATP-binding protein [Jannaschia sp. M317]UWQ16175.1 GHKL domain-containing protein [Jannaschia sp. M317]